MSAVGSKSFIYTNITQTGIVTVPFDVTNFDDISFVFCNDSGGAVNAVMQMTNQLPNGDYQMISRVRDDSLTSYDWTSNLTPSTAGVSISNLAAGASAAALVSCQAFRAVRFKLTANTTTNVTSMRVYAFASGTPS